MQLITISLVVALVGTLVGCTGKQTSNSDTAPTTQTPPAVQSSPPIPANLSPAGSHDHAAETSVVRIGIAEADAAVKEGQAIILDVRAASAFKAGHIKGSLSMPEAEIAARASMLPKGKKIITYCS